MPPPSGSIFVKHGSHHSDGLITVKSSVSSTSSRSTRAKKIAGWLPVQVAVLMSVFIATNLTAASFLYYKIHQLQEMDDVMGFVEQQAEPFPKQKDEPVDVTSSYMERSVSAILGEIKAKELKGILGKIKSELLRKDVVSCRWNGTNFTLFNAECEPDVAESYIYFNGISQPRFMCNQQIAPYSFGTFSEPCNNPSHLSTKKVPTVVIENWDPTRLVNMHEHECDIPCFSIGKENIYTRLKIRGTPFKFLKSMESNRSNAHLTLDPMAYRENQFISSTDFRSEIPIPYYSRKDYNIQTPAVGFHDVISGAVFLARNCNPKNDREKIVKEVSKLFRVDALSSCLHNAQPPRGVNLQNKTDLMRSYMFYFAFENSNVHDYITEKLWGALESVSSTPVKDFLCSASSLTASTRLPQGTIPVYFGAPNVQEHVPPNSIIAVDDFQNYTDLALYLKKVSENKSLYESYHEWRSRPLPPSFIQKYRMTEIHSTCRLCRWTHARKYGLRWDHTSQSIEKSKISRKLCLSSNGLMVQPLVESFSGLTVNTSNVDCSASNRSGVASINGTTRNVQERDNVIDLFVNSVYGSIATWQFRVPFEKPRIVAPTKGQIWTEDTESRITVVVYPRVDIVYKRNSVWIPALPNLKVRIIVEDLDVFHENAWQGESYFGSTMKEDLWNPIEGFTLGVSNISWIS